MLRAPFEPVALYGVLGTRGFAHWSERIAEGDWMIWFHPVDGPSTAAPAAARTAGAPTLHIDVRGLDPPEPMMRVLEAVDRLPAGQTLEVLHERRPIFLYPQLDDRGFVHETDEPEPGTVRIVIRRGEAGA